MSKRLPTTPRSFVRGCLRMIFVRSRERAAAIKRDKNTCKKCGRKGSVAKGNEVRIEVHHREGVGNWDKVMSALYDELLCHPDNLECMCKECHKEESNES